MNTAFHFQSTQQINRKAANPSFDSKFSITAMGHINQALSAFRISVGFCGVNMGTCYFC